MRIPSRGLWLVAALVVLAAAFLAGRLSSPEVSLDEVFQGRGPMRSRECPPGPWGHVRYYPVVIEMPGEMISVESMPRTNLRWYVRIADPGAIQDFLQTNGMRESSARVVAGTAVPDGTGAGLWLRPPPELVRQIVPERRAPLYRALARYPENTSQCNPFRYDGRAPLEWFDQTGLHPETVSLLKELCYPENGDMYFADHDLALMDVGNEPGQLVELVRVLSRCVTMVANLIVERDEDTAGLVAYWGNGGREREVRPIIEATRLSKGISAVPLALLLPPFARARLFTYRNDADGDNPNCHYSSLNFFAVKPRAEYQDLRIAAEALQRDHMLVQPPLQFGDIVALCDAEGGVIHSCNFIAGDLVFTKNGGAIGQPWSIQTIEDILRLYGRAAPVTVSYYRRRPGA